MSSMGDERILLTGGNGMVGKNFLEHPEIATLDVLTPSSKELDLTNFEAVSLYLVKHKPTMVIHAAGRVGGIQANIREPVLYLLDNLDMGRNVVLGARRAGVRRLINLGSSCMYPRNHSEPMGEELMLKGELEPTNEGYALAKVVTARLCEYITREDNAYNYKTLIPCNLYGRYDKFDPAHSHLIPAIINKIHQAKIRKEEVIDIWGDGTARREFMYAGDFVDALVRAVKEFDSLPSMLNIGLGEDYSINEYYEIAAEVMGYKGKFAHDLSKPAGMQRKLLDITRQLQWGWSAKSDLRAGIDRTYQFYLKEYLQ